jgi:hypothetical protein
MTGSPSSGSNVTSRSSDRTMPLLAGTVSNRHTIRATTRSKRPGSTNAGTHARVGPIGDLAGAVPGCDGGGLALWCREHFRN